jgi:hypothetical protein
VLESVDSKLKPMHADEINKGQGCKCRYFCYQM